MKIHAVTTQANGIISVVIQASFVGDPSDATDKQKIAAFGDPLVNIAGTFADPQQPSFTFQFPTTEKFVGITTQLASQTANFMLALPAQGNPNQPAPIQGPMDCVTTNPSEAASAWYAVVVGRIQQAMQALRAKFLVPTLPDYTV